MLCILDLNDPMLDIVFLPDESGVVLLQEVGDPHHFEAFPGFAWFHFTIAQRVERASHEVLFHIFLPLLV